MKIYAIIDEERPDIDAVGYLMYYERQKEFRIELPDNIDPWYIPMPFVEAYIGGTRTISSYMSRYWVQLRIVPHDRQNINSILVDNGLVEYDEHELLRIAEGRCSQDSLAIRSIQELPEELRMRRKRGVREVVTTEKGRLYVFFEDGSARKCDIEKLFSDDRRFIPVLNNRKRFDEARVQPGGYGVCWGDNIVATDFVLYDKGVPIDIEYEDFRHFAENQIINTSEASDMMCCSRQNIKDLVERGKLKPVRSFAKNLLFLKGDIEKRKW